MEVTYFSSVFSKAKEKFCFSCSIPFNGPMLIVGIDQRLRLMSATILWVTKCVTVRDELYVIVLTAWVTGGPDPL
jgi:hypothetical protein